MVLSCNILLGDLVKKLKKLSQDFVGIQNSALANNNKKIKQKIIKVGESDKEFCTRLKMGNYNFCCGKRARSLIVITKTLT